LLPLQILYIFVSPLSAVVYITHPSILVVGSFHHTSRSIHLTSFTSSNRLYWIHLELVCCQVAHIWSIGSPLAQLADSFVKLTGNMIKKKEGIYFKFSVSFIVYLCTFLYFCFTISWQPTTKRDKDGDEPTNQPVDKMVNQYFRWRCELLDNRPIQGEFNKYNWKWWKMWDGYYDLNGEMIQLPRWMCYDSFCGWSSGNGETKIQKCTKINNKWNRKFKINTFFFLDHIASQFHWIVTFTNSLYFCFTTVSCWS
jgi:hypothetical protein